jgi:hypothetical protein
VTAALITGHVFRTLMKGHGTIDRERCGFMNCRRPPAEHERATVGRRW